ncbi:hypothetical protein PanWU01x14_146690 [Parasponia andersonii]|uniref:Uncharacterized protein n=1 Tax=Parasponia andersonii TaxID=3476 RepID=A0A2P5CJU5_PARAD|nr:hypothetical protein PanWU01x14_146690 [Parasponia andersonii]
MYSPEIVNHPVYNLRTEYLFPPDFFRRSRVEITVISPITVAWFPPSPMARVCQGRDLDKSPLCQDGLPLTHTYS